MLMKSSAKINLKGLRNCILCIIRVWSLFCSARVYISLHFLPVLLVKLGFRLSVFQFVVFLYLWLSIFSFALCFELNVFLKDIVLSGNIIIMFSLYSNDLLKYKNCVIKTYFQRGFEFKNFIYKEKFHLQSKISFVKKNMELLQK